MSYMCVKAAHLLGSPCAECPSPRACHSTLPKNIKAAHKEIKARTLDLATFQPVFASITRVPIVMAGVEYQLASGPATFTPEDIQDFVTSQDDPAIVPPRLKIGHTSKLSDPKVDGILRDGDDGVPAIGKFINIGFDASTITAIGDLVGVPIWLATLLQAGLLYPNRSIEGFQEAETVTGNTWGLVVHAVALLGCVWPGCATLDDLPVLYTEDGPDDLELYNQEGDLIEVGTAAQAVAASGRSTTAAPTRPVEAAVNVDDVRRAFYNELGNLDLSMWSWIRAVYLDPNELIVDNDEGELYRVPFTISGEEVEFSDPAEVRIQYVDAAARVRRQQRAAHALALSASHGRQLAVYASREESRQSVTNSEEESNMTPEQLAALGLPRDATRAQIHARLITLAAEADPAEDEETPAPDAGGPGGPANDPDRAGDGGEPEEEETPPETTPPANAATPPANGQIDPAVLAQLQAAGLSVIPTTTFTQVQRDAAAGASAARQTVEQQREDMIAGAIREGRIRSADAPTYRNMFAAQATAEIARSLLTATVEDGGLRPDMVPVSERGEVPGGDASHGGDLAAGSYDKSWLSPQERARIDAIHAGDYTPPTVQTDDPTRVKTAA